MGDAPIQKGNNEELEMSSSLIELAGYLASFLVAYTFYMKTMLPLRCFAIASNVAFIVYGFFNELYPVLFLHLFLLPLNVTRLRQIKNLIKDVREASTGDFSLEWLLPYMHKSSYAKGAVIFTKGEDADEMLYIHTGKVRLTDIDGIAQPLIVNHGNLVGEIGIFAPHGKRTATAIADEDTDVYKVGQAGIVELYYQNPAFAFYLVKLITRRLIENQTRAGVVVPG